MADRNRCNCVRCAQRNATGIKPVSGQHPDHPARGNVARDLVLRADSVKEPA